MKAPKLIIEILLLIAFMLCTAFFLEWRYKGFTTHCDILYNGIDNGLDSTAILYIGNSRTLIFTGYFPDTTQKTRNFSYPGFDLFEEYAMLKKYVPRMKRLQKIYLNLDYEELGYNMSYFGQDYVVRQLYKYNDTLYKNTLLDKMMAKSNFFRSNRDIIFLFTKKRTATGEAIDFKSLPLKQSNNNGDAECRRRALEVTSAKFSTKFIKENISLLQQIINLAKEYRVSLTLFDVPKTPCYISFADKNNMAASKQKIDSVLTANHLKYYDYYNDHDFTENDFGNVDHLSLAGAKKLMDKISKEELK